MPDYFVRHRFKRRWIVIRIAGFSRGCRGSPTGIFSINDIPKLAKSFDFCTFARSYKIIPDMKTIIASPKAPAAIGPYCQAQVLNGTLFASGQLPINPATGEMPATIEEQTRQSLLNLQAIVEEAGLMMNDVVKTTVLLANIGDFAAMNAVYAEFFPDSKPARMCYAVKDLPKAALVEIDCIAGK